MIPPNMGLFRLPRAQTLRYTSQVSDRYRSSAEAASEQLRLMKEVQLLQDQLKRSTQRYGRSILDPAHFLACSPRCLISALPNRCVSSVAAMLVFYVLVSTEGRALYGSCAARLAVIAKIGGVWASSSLKGGLCARYV